MALEDQRSPQRSDGDRSEGRIDKLPIGPTLRARRHQLGLSLQQVADRSGLSIAFISQAERGHATPSIISLMNLSRALGVDINYFIDVPKGSSIVRRAAEPEYIKTDSPASYIRLTGGLPQPQLEALMITVPAGLVAPPVQREGEGFYYIVEGTLEVNVGSERFVLGAGDSIHFDQRHRYAMANPAAEPVRILWVGTPVLFD
jgi:transcriptional regulator with XRE-family HTH domain